MSLLNVFHLQQQSPSLLLIAIREPGEVAQGEVWCCTGGASSRSSSVGLRNIKPHSPLADRDWGSGGSADHVADDPCHGYSTRPRACSSTARCCPSEL